MKQLATARAARTAIVISALLGFAGCIEPVRSVSGTGTGSGTGSGARATKSGTGAGAADPQLAEAFTALKQCGYSNGRLDYRCPQLRRLRRLLRERRRIPARRGPVIQTLAKMLGAKSEIVRLVAADSVYFYHRKRPIIAALWRALKSERAGIVKATMLRQLCWRKSPKVEHDARTRLVNTSDEPVAVRAEAATCLGRQRHAATASLAALRRALVADSAPVVQGNACAALGAQRAKAALDDIIAKLRVPNVGWRCATALSMIGGKKAYDALVKATVEGITKHRLTTPQVSALAAFAPRPEVDRGKLGDLLARIAAARMLAVLVRASAVRALGRLGAVRQLEALAKRYAAAKSKTDAYLKASIARALPTARAARAKAGSAKKKQQKKKKKKKQKKKSKRIGKPRPKR